MSNELLIEDIQLGEGKLPDKEGRLFSAAQSREMWSPVVILPNRKLPPPLEEQIRQREVRVSCAYCRPRSRPQSAPSGSRRPSTT